MARSKQDYVTSSVRLPKVLDEKVIKIVDELGISKNAAFILIMNDYFKQQDALSGMTDLLSKFDKIIEDKKVENQDRLFGRRFDN